MISKTIELYKSAYKGLSPATWWLSLVMFVNRSGTMVLPFLTIYLTQHLHYSIAQAGWVMAIFGAGAIVGALIGGKVSDKIGFRSVQLVTLTGGGIMFMVLGQMKSFPLICICTFVLSLINEAFRPANSSAIAFYSTTANRTRSYSLNRLAINLGWAFGAGLGGVVASVNYSLLFWVDGITNLLAAFLLWRFLSPTHAPIQPKQNEKHELNASAYKDKLYIWFIILTTVFAICFFQNFTILPVYFKEQLGLNEYFIGLVLGFNGVLIALFEMVIVFKLEGKRHGLFYISIGTLFVGVSYIILNIFHFMPEIVAFISIILVTIGEILAMPFMNSFWVARTTTQNRGQYASLYTIAYSAAQVVAPTFGAQIAQHFNFNILWWLVGGISVLTVFGYQWLQRKVVEEVKTKGAVADLTVEESPSMM